MATRAAGGDDIEQRAAAALGQAAYDNFKQTLGIVVDTLTRPATDEPR